MTRPTLSYTIWFSQRTGSTWFCEMLAETGYAGRPGEYLVHASGDEALAHHGVADAAALVRRVIELGTTENGVFGIKQGYSEHAFGSILELIGGAAPMARLARWESAFPNHRHIFMTRRNKLRLAVSWWRAIKSGEWHRRRGEAPSTADLSDAYDAVAIDTLMQQAVVREAGLQELFSDANVIPLQIAYEDLVQDPLGQINRTLEFLDLPLVAAIPKGARTEPTAGALTEEWVQRFRKDRQAGWDNPAW
jgi:LPS sulfotransferase NodH